MSEIAPKRRAWLAEPLPSDVERALERLERTEDVAAVAVMPDVHLSNDVCIGTVTATHSRLLPNAVGGDIGCGMQAIAFDLEADCVDRPDVAAKILSRLYARVPILRHGTRDGSALPAPLEEQALSVPSLESQKRREGALQLGTVGRGNHFVELQRDDQDRLWAMVHTGSRGLGQSIRAHHLGVCQLDAITGMEWLFAEERDGQAYLHDVGWAREYARRNRSLITERVVETVHEVVGAHPVDSTRIDADHNHVQRETHRQQELWVHRKGAQAAWAGAIGIIPGSMGTPSFHVRGRGKEEALCSSSHGAGRAMSRTEARRAISRKQLAKDTVGVWYDHRLQDKLREEAPAAYKDIGRVMRAQRDLVGIVRRLRPVLVYKGV